VSIANKGNTDYYKGVEVMRKSSGFTIIELMIVVAIVAILVALAIPSFSQWARKAKRGDAQALLLNWSNNQEIWRANNPQYATAAQLTPPVDDDGNYTFSLNGAPTATTYQLQAVAQGGQAADVERGTSCTTMRIDQNGAKTPEVCWQE